MRNVIKFLSICTALFLNVALTASGQTALTITNINGNVCVGDNAGFSVPNTCTINSWTASTGGTFTGATNVPRVNVTWSSASSSGWVQVNYSNCATSFLAVVITATSVPAVSISSPSPVSFCHGGQQSMTVNATGTNITGTANYNWYLDSQTTAMAVTTAPTYTFSVSALSIGTHTVKVTASNLSCSTAASVTSSALSFTVKGVPAAGTLTLSPPSLCVGSTVTVSGSGTGTSYFSCVRDGIVTIFDHAHAAASSFSDTPAAAGTYLYKLQYENECDIGPEVTASLVVGAKGDVAGIGGPISTFPATPNTYTALSTSTITSFTWTVTGGSIVSGQGTASAVINFPTGAGTVTLSGGNVQCPTGISYALPVTTASMNYVREEDVVVAGVVNSGDVTSLTVLSKSQTTNYIDGIGRPLQAVSWQSSPLKGDVVNAQPLDTYGRPYKKMLPVVIAAGTGQYQSTLLDANDNYTTNFYLNSGSMIAYDSFPYAVTQFETSPLNRPKKQGAPGKIWQPNTVAASDHSVKMKYENNAASDVILFSYDQSTGIPASDSATVRRYYLARQLTVVRTLDEHNNEVVEYKDKQNRVVCKRVQYKTTTDAVPVKLYANTYYIYDDLGNLAVVLPPEAVKMILSSK